MLKQSNSIKCTTVQIPPATQSMSIPYRLSGLLEGGGEEGVPKALSKPRILLIGSMRKGDRREKPSGKMARI